MIGENVVSDKNLNVSYLDIIEGSSEATYKIQTHADGPSGKIPFTPEILINEPAGTAPLV